MRLARKVRLLPNKQQENKLKEILKSKEQIENIKFDKNILDSIYIEKIGKIKTSEKILKEICIQSIKIKQYKDKIYMFYDFKIAKKS